MMGALQNILKYKSRYFKPDPLLSLTYPNLSLSLTKPFTYSSPTQILASWLSLEESSKFGWDLTILSRTYLYPILAYLYPIPTYPFTIPNYPMTPKKLIPGRQLSGNS